MLINIDPILGPEVLHTLRAMGHGDKLILCDSNFPAYSMNSRVHRIDGVNAARAAEAIQNIGKFHLLRGLNFMMKPRKHLP